MVSVWHIYYSLVRVPPGHGVCLAVFPEGIIIYYSVVRVPTGHYVSLAEFPGGIIIHYNVDSSLRAQCRLMQFPQGLCAA